MVCNSQKLYCILLYDLISLSRTNFKMLFGVHRIEYLYSIPISKSQRHLTLTHPCLIFEVVKFFCNNKFFILFLWNSLSFEYYVYKPTDATSAFLIVKIFHNTKIYESMSAISNSWIFELQK